MSCSTNLESSGACRRRGDAAAICPTPPRPGAVWSAKSSAIGSAEPDAPIAELKEDETIDEAGALLLIAPNQLGVDDNAHVAEPILKHFAPAFGWR